MSEQKMVEVRVNIAVDVPYYQTITVKVPEDLLPEEREVL